MIYSPRINANRKKVICSVCNDKKGRCWYYFHTGKSHCFNCGALGISIEELREKKLKRILTLKK